MRTIVLEEQPLRSKVQELEEQLESQSLPNHHNQLLIAKLIHHEAKANDLMKANQTMITECARTRKELAMSRIEQLTLDSMLKMSNDDLIRSKAEAQQWKEDLREVLRELNHVKLAISEFNH